MTPARRSGSQSSRLQRLVNALSRHYGAPSPPVTTDPFALILWEQVGYLADDAKRLLAFTRLETEVGLTPTRVVEASRPQLVAIATAGGSIAAEQRAERMQQSARVVLEEWGGDLTRLLDLPEAKAKRALTRFPMIGAPGAEKILLITKRRRGLALDSNGLRVLVRLGYGRAMTNYAAMYRGVQSGIEGEVRADYRWLWKAHQLLRRHGQELCKHRVPVCGACPLRAECPFKRASSKRGA